MRLAAWLLASASILCAGVVHAQDDWALTRPDRPHVRPTTPRARGVPRPHPRVVEATPSARLLERYREMVERDPNETFALTRWVALATERDGSTDPIAREMAAARAADPAAIVPRLVLAHLARRAGRPDDARGLYGEIIAAHPDALVGYAELARTEREAGASPAARDAYERARELARGETADALAREELEILVALDDVSRASALDASLAGAHPSVERRLELPRAWLAHHRPERAIEALAAVESRIAGDPRARVPVRMERARAELALGHADEALASIDVVLASARGGLRVEAYELAREAHRQAGTLDALVATLAREHAPEAFELLARIEDERGHDEAAVAAYDRAIRARPRAGELRRRRAHVLLRMGRVAEAAEALQALYRASPDEPDRLIEAATLLVDEGREADARALLVAASSARARDVRLHARLAEVFARWGDDAHALAEAQTLARLEPADPEHRALVADLLLARGDRAGALSTFREMLTLDASAAGHDRLGMALADHDLLDDARAELAEAARLAPDDREVLAHLAEVLVRAGRDADAEPVASRLVQLCAGDPSQAREARMRLVSIWARRRTLDRHVSALETAFAATPPDRVAGTLLAEALRRSGALARSEEVLVRLAALSPDDVDAWTTLERVRALRGDLSGAIEALDHAASADTARAASYLARMSEHALALYRDDDAIAYAERALALAPDDAHGHVRLGDLYRRRQQTSDAMQSYQRALALDPSQHEVALQLAELTREAGDAAAADALFGSVIERSPDDDLVTRAIDQSLQIELASGSAEPLLDRLLTLAALSYDRTVLSRAALGVLDALASPLLSRADADGPAALAARAELHGLAARALGVLLRALSGSDPSEQQTALAILSAARVEAAAPALLAASEGHRDGTFGAEALLAAARTAGPSLVPRLATIAHGTDAPRAAIATWGLARIGDASALRELETLAAGDTDVAALAALGLAHTGDVERAPSLARAAAHRTGATQRATFVAALAALGTPPSASECASLTEAGGRARTIALLTCSDDAQIAQALVQGVDAPGAVRAALHVSTDLRESWPEPRAGEPAAALALRAIDRAPPHLPRASLGDALASAIEVGLGGAAAVAIVHVLDAREGALALSGFDASASHALLEGHTDAILDALPAASPDPALRASVARLLAELRPSDPRIDGLLGDGAREVVRAALEGLAGRGAIAPALVPRLAALLSGSEDWVARLGAARVLALAPEGAEDALVGALEHDEFAFVREAAAAALGARAGSVGLDALRQAAAADPEERVRQAAAAALARRGVALR